MSITEIYDQAVAPLSPDERLQLAALILSRMTPTHPEAADAHSSQRADEPENRSMADLFAGRTGLVAGGGTAFSENGGQRFAEHLARKHRKSAEGSQEQP